MKNINSKVKRFSKIFILILGVLVIFLVFKIFQNSKNEPLPTPFTRNAPSKAEVIKISPLGKVSGFEYGAVYGVSKRNGNLVRFEENKETTVYTGKVNDYYIRGNIALILDDSNLSEIVVLNLDTEERSELSFSAISPVISVTLSDDLQTIYFLAGFDISKKISSINSVSINGEGHTKLGETSAQNLRFLRNNTILLFQSVHEQNASVVGFFDTNNRQETFSQITNTFQVSPDKRNVLLQKTNRVSIVNTETLQIKSKFTQQSSRSVWKDTNTVILLRNTDQGVAYSTLNITPFELSPFQLLVPDLSILTAFGFVGKNLIWEDYKENIFTTEVAIN